MRRDILTAGLTVLGVYFLANGGLSLISGVTNFYLSSELHKDPNVRMVDGALQMKIAVVYLVVPLCSIMFGLSLLCNRTRQRIVNLLANG